MASQSPQVILYAYPLSPFAQKISFVLLFKKINYKLVDVSRAPPRPQLADELGIKYRRIPVLAIDGDVFIDTSLIAAELERRFPASAGYPSLFPEGSKGNSGLQLGAMQWWADKPLFKVVTSLLPEAILNDEAFVKDRSSFRGTPIVKEQVLKMAPLALSALQSHLSDIELQLAQSSTRFLLGTSTPTLIDISLFFTVNWVDGLGTASDIMRPKDRSESPSPRALQWVQDMREAIVAAKRDSVTAGANAGSGTSNPLGGEIVDGKAARDVILSSKTIPVKVDPREPLVKAGWFKEGDNVQIVPDDTGKVPQAGKLIGLNAHTATLEVPVPSGGGGVHVHFPRHGYMILKGDSKL